MRQLMSKLWNDDGGALIAIEWIFVATIMVIGLVTGLVSVRNAVVNELNEVANAVLGLQQCYAFSGLSGCGASTCGSVVTDVQVQLETNNSSVATSAAIDTSPCN